MPMSSHSIHNPARRRIRSSSYETFRDRFNTRRWPISRDHHSWPYPEHRDVWDRIENTFNTEEDFEDLRIQDFVLAGRQTAQRRLDRLTMPRGQTSVLERGSLQLREHEKSDTSVDTALGYTSIVGTMLAEELANADNQIVALQERVQEAELSAARSNAALASLIGRVRELEMSQRLTTARLATLPANVVDLTVEVREEPEEVVPESPIWDWEEELSMDDEEDGRANEVVYRLRPNMLTQLVPIETLVHTSDSVGEGEHMPSTGPLVIQDYQAEVELQRLEAREEGYVEMNQAADEMVVSEEGIPDPYLRMTDPETLQAIPDPPDYEGPPTYWRSYHPAERVVDTSVPDELRE